MEIIRREVVGRQVGPHVLITGGVHGDEFEPMAAVRRLRSVLEGKLNRGRATLVPVANEPAFKLGRRTAEDNLDLARTCPGKADGTITERIAHALSALIQTADYYVDLHTGGVRLRVLPLVGYTLHGDLRVLEAQRRMARAFGLPIIWGTDPNLQGRTLSVARDARIPAIYAEYQGGGMCDPAGVQSYVNGCVNVLAALGMVEGTSSRPETEPIVVEDPQPGSGHMQVNHPSPCEGFFEPAVSLGEQITAGQLLGTVTDCAGERIESIHARHAGLVAVLHTFSQVNAGDGLAVVIELDRK